MSEPNSPKLRVATYNVHSCYGMDRKRSEARIAEVIAELDVDLVGLQELDLSRPRSGGVDQAGLIAEQLGWHRYFHPAMETGAEHYGNAILSRYPLTLRQARTLPGAGTFYCRESRVAISMDVETPLGAVHIINTHFGLGRSERLLQAQLLNDELLATGSADLPLILLGDFNSLPGSRTCRALARHLQDARKLVAPVRAFRTFPTSFPAFAVDHIFVNAALRPIGLDVHRSPLARVASDHYPLVAEFVRA